MYCNQNGLRKEPQARPETDLAQSTFQDIVCWCSDQVLCFLAVLFALTLGLILATIIDLTASLPALTILAVVLAILIAVALIVKGCRCCRKRC